MSNFFGPARLLCPWDPPGMNIVVGYHSLLQGIFLTQGLNLGLWHCWWILYCLSHQDYQRINGYILKPSVKEAVSLSLPPARI